MFVYFSVLEIGWSFFLTFTLMTEIKMQFLADCKEVMALSFEQVEWSTRNFGLAVFRKAVTHTV